MMSTGTPRQAPRRMMAAAFCGMSGSNRAIRMAPRRVLTGKRTYPYSTYYPIVNGDYNGQIRSLEAVFDGPNHFRISDDVPRNRACSRRKAAAFSLQAPPMVGQ